MPLVDSDEFLAHYGVKGMKWGRRKASDDSSGGDKKADKASKKVGKLDLKISKSDASVQERAKSVANLETHIADLRQNGTKAKIFKTQFGDWPAADDADFTRKFGKSKTQAIADFDQQLTSMRNSEAIALNMSASRNKRLKTKRDKLSHDDLLEDDVDELGHVDENDTLEFLAHYGVEVEEEDPISYYDTGVDLDDTLAHYGVKGMRWGHRKSGEAVSDKKLARLNKRADKGDMIRARSKTTGGAYGKIAARRVGVAVGITVLQKGVEALAPNNPTLKMGSAVALGIVNQGMFVKDIVDANRVRTSVKRERTS